MPTRFPGGVQRAGTSLAGGRGGPTPQQAVTTAAVRQQTSQAQMIQEQIARLRQEREDATGLRPLKIQLAKEQIEGEKQRRLVDSRRLEAETQANERRQSSLDEHNRFLRAEQRTMNDLTRRRKEVELEHAAALEAAAVLTGEAQAEKLREATRLAIKADKFRDDTRYHAAATNAAMSELASFKGVPGKGTGQRGERITRTGTRAGQRLTSYYEGLSTAGAGWDVTIGRMIAGAGPKLSEAQEKELASLLAKHEAHMQSKLARSGPAGNIARRIFVRGTSAAGLDFVAKGDPGYDDRVSLGIVSADQRAQWGVGTKAESASAGFKTEEEYKKYLERATTEEERKAKVKQWKRVFVTRESWDRFTARESITSRTTAEREWRKGVGAPLSAGFAQLYFGNLGRTGSAKGVEKQTIALRKTITDLTMNDKRLREPLLDALDVVSGSKSFDDLQEGWRKQQLSTGQLYGVYRLLDAASNAVSDRDAQGILQRAKRHLIQYTHATGRSPVSVMRGLMVNAKGVDKDGKLITALKGRVDADVVTLTGMIRDRMPTAQMQKVMAIKTALGKCKVSDRAKVDELYAEFRKELETLRGMNKKLMDSVDIQLQGVMTYNEMHMKLRRKGGTP